MLFDCFAALLRNHFVKLNVFKQFGQLRFLPDIYAIGHGDVAFRAAARDAPAEDDAGPGFGGLRDRLTRDPRPFIPLFLLIGIGISGFWLRYIGKTDIVAVKELVLGLAGFKPAGLGAVDPLFYAHLFLASILVAYFPVSKLMHMAGVFLSPTRNMANNNRMARHVNPWDYPVKVHTYEEYEDEFRDKMKAAGLPLEKE